MRTEANQTNLDNPNNPELVPLIDEGWAWSQGGKRLHWYEPSSGQWFSLCKRSYHAWRPSFRRGTLRYPKIFTISAMSVA